MQWGPALLHFGWWHFAGDWASWTLACQLLFRLRTDKKLQPDSSVNKTTLKQKYKKIKMKLTQMLLLLELLLLLLPLVKLPYKR